MIKGQKKLNVTYMASVIEAGEQIEGETCVDIQMAEDIVDLLLQDKEDVRKPDKAAYLNRISELGAEDQAFLDGYLFAKLTAARRGA